MNTIQEMLTTHPQKPTTHFDAVSACIAACFECEQVCTLCADACLGEKELEHLRQCIRLDLDCADVCGATGRMIARQAAPDPQLWRLTLEACAEACRACAVECSKHAAKFGHCRICREACLKCERACREVLQAYPTGGTQARH